MAKISNNNSIDGLPPDMSGTTGEKDNAALIKDCVLNKDGEYVVIRPVRDNDTKEIVNYTIIRKVTEADLNNKDLIPADWSPKGKISLKQAQKQLHDELVDYFNNIKAMDELFDSIDNDNDQKLTNQSTLEDLLSSSKVSLEEKLINASLFGINVEDPSGSGRKVNMRDVYFAKDEQEQTSVLVKSYIDSLPDKRQNSKKEQNELPVHPDNFLHCRKNPADEYHLPAITKNPANKAKNMQVYLGDLFKGNPLFDGSCTEMISEANAKDGFELPEHRDEEIAQGVNVLGASGKSNIILTGPAGTGKTYLAKGIVYQAAKRLKQQQKPMVAYAVDFQRLINSGSGVFGEWQKKAYSLLQALKRASTGVYQWIIQMIYNYNIDIEKLNKIVYKRVPLMGDIPATVPFLQNMLNIALKLEAEGKLPEYKTVVFADEFHQAFEIGRNGSDNSPFLDIIKPDLEIGTFSMIGATTEDEYSKYVKDPAIRTRFVKVNVTELNKTETFDILKSAAEKLTFKAKKEGHPIVLTDENLIKIIETANNYLFNVKNPRASIDLLNKVVTSVINSNYFQTREMSNLEIKISKLNSRLKSQEPDSSEYVLTKNQIKEFKLNYKQLDKELQNKIKNIKSSGGLKISAEDIMTSVSRIINANPLMFARNKKDKLNVFAQEIYKKIIGHHQVKDQLIKDYASKLSVLNENRTSPVVTLLVGVPGVGKTETGEQLGKIEGLPVKTLAMNEYSSPASETNLFGAPKGHVGSTDPSEFISFVKANPFCVVILDEVEKTCPAIMNKFLQIFEKGYYYDKLSGENVPFKGVHFVLTSNALEEDLSQNPNISLKELKNRLKNYKAKSLYGFEGSIGSANNNVFSAALLSRVGDNIYGFGNLSQGELFKLVELKLENLKNEVATSSLKLNINYGEPLDSWKKEKAKFEKTLVGESELEKTKKIIDWEIKNASKKYPDNSIVYAILDKVMAQNGDGRYVGKIIDACLTKQFDWITLALKREDVKDYELVIELNNKNEIDFKMVNLKNKAQKPINLSPMVK